MTLEYTTICGAVLGVFCGCATPAPADLTDIADLAERLQTSYTVDILPSVGQVAPLQWRAPSCEQVYRIRIDEQYPEDYIRMTHLQEEHSERYLVLAPDPGRTADGGEIWHGRSLVFSPGEAAKKPRELLLSEHMLGPASPDAACYERTWNPTEDGLALGWPLLPGRPVAVAETWVGNPVEARCNRIACIDPQTRGGGESAHDLTCVTMSWREHLDGLYELGGQQVAAISSFWSDGHPLDVGVWSERVALVTTTGRLVYAHATIHHNFLGITRDIVIDAVDDCPGSLPSAGFDPPAAVLDAVARAREQLTPGK